ncbi:type II toxin-antitoxin system VapC family toxin [Brachybacterium alimentarium]|uniref:type II toxin-antitoxin system VapC family toxin n=1 Tax=Brachybacterium alimentarium TaxID=47845 RepID=UPI000DF4A586|nr:type II toxin-antitoxin system VapC family toxin [Brachybacterium alimentarium]RCS83349.1 PIN domain-containing protein [Brachybacterium alimentarium]
MIVYLDASAVLKILIDEPGTAAMRDSFNGWQGRGDDIVSSYLLHTELHCAARRRGFVEREVLDMLLAGIGLIDIDRSHLLAASRLSHPLRSADAIHCATALAIDADALVTYDRELADAARSAAITPLSPGA